MPIAAFDTLKFARQLKQSGVPEEQAEAHTAALADAMQAGLQELATKHDVELLRQEIAMIRQDVKQDLKSLETRVDGQMALLKWMLGATLAGVIGILIRLFFFRVV